MNHEVGNHQKLGEIKNNQTEVQKQSEKQKAETQAFTKAIDRDFTTFSPKEKFQLLQLIQTHTKLKPRAEKKEFYLKVIKYFKESKDSPSWFLQKLENHIKRSIQDSLKISSSSNKIIKVSDKKIESKNQKNEKLKDNIKQLKENYKKLDTKHQISNTTKIQETAKSLSTETQRKLQKQGISADEYAKFLLSRDSIVANNDNSISSRDFLNTLQNLEKSLNITPPNKHPDQQGFHTDYILRNPDLQKQIKSNPDFQQLDGSLNFSWLKKPSEVFNFVKRFGSEELKKKIDQISTFFNPDETLKPLNQEEYQQLVNFQSALKSHQTAITKRSEEKIKMAIQTAPITAIKSCLDQESLENLPLSDTLLAPTENSATIKTQGSNDILNIKGTISWTPVNFYYNLTNPNATLQCDDHVHYSEDNNRITINNTQKTDLNIQMPTTKDLIEKIKKQCTPETMQKLFEISKDPENYQWNLQSFIRETIEESFEINDEIKSRICLQTEKNLTSQEFSMDFLPPHLSTQLQNPQILNNNPQVKKLFQILDHISENSTSEELIMLRKGFKKLNSMINNPQLIDKIADPVVKEHFLNLQKSLEPNITIAKWTENLFNFFNLFLRHDYKNQAFDHRTLTNNQIFNFLDFENFLNLPKRPTKLKSAKLQSQFSEQFMKHYNKTEEEIDNRSIPEGLLALEQKIAEIAYA